ncbi:MAG: hypothetical protein J2P48_08870 [Alphaproteobacteria bacterium]|nr:hypothetical protein [Alphaproteobacteria bacterium]
MPKTLMMRPMTIMVVVSATRIAWSRLPPPPRRELTMEDGSVNASRWWSKVAKDAATGASRLGIRV